MYNKNECIVIIPHVKEHCGIMMKQERKRFGKFLCFDTDGNVEYREDGTEAFRTIEKQFVQKVWRDRQKK